MSLKQCCATGSLHTGTPQGRVDKLHGLDCYIAEPPTDSPKGVVVIIPDAFGWELPNNRILADEYAKNGNFRVILPDFMNGFVMPADVMISFKALSATGFWNQLYKISHALYLARYFVPFLIYCREAVARPKILSFFQSLRAANPLPIGAAGFCWGGKYVVELCWDSTRTDAGRRLLDCGFIAHPSMLKYPGDIEKVVLPLSCAAAEIDQQMSAEDAAATRKVLEGKTAKTREEGVEHEFVMYEGAHHGFAVRADEEDLDTGTRAPLEATTARQWHPQLQATIVLPIDDLEQKNASAPQPQLVLAAATATRCGEFLPHLASHIATPILLAFSKPPIRGGRQCHSLISF